MLKRVTIEENEKYLRQSSLNVDFNNDEYKSEIESLRDYCLHSELYALAPIQIGIPKRMIFIRNTSSDMTKNTDSHYNEEILHMDRISQTSLMTLDQMKEYREKHPYLIINEDNEFIYESKNVNQN